MIEILGSIQLLSTFLMAFIVMMTQWVIYPQFGNVGILELADVAKFHQRRISYIVMPIMGLEVGSLISLSFYNMFSPVSLFLAALLLFVVWVITFLKLVPIHLELAKGRSQKRVPALLRWNAIRLACWTLKLVVLIGGLQ